MNFLKRLSVLLVLALVCFPAQAAQTISTISVEDEASDWPAVWNAFVDTIVTQYAGTARPLFADTGTIWYNTGDKGLYFFDGASDVLITALDTSNHVAMTPLGGGATSLASAATVDLGSVAHGSIILTGSNTITGFGSSMKAGQIKILTFASALTLTNSATLVLPGAANITTSAGDVAGVMCTAAGSYKIIFYLPAAGIGLTSIASKTGLVNTSPTAAAPVATSFSDWLDAVFGTGQGRMLFRGPLVWEALTAGVSGYFLKSQGSGANPVWASVFSLPSMSGQAGKYLTNDGTSSSWGSVTTGFSSCSISSSGGSYSAVATCSTGFVTGGGCSAANANKVISSYPNSTTSWTCTSADSSSMTSYAVCCH